MHSNGTRARANDSMHILNETENDLLKPINENRTSSSVPNPFVQARAERLRTLEVTVQNEATQQGQ